MTTTRLLMVSVELVTLGLILWLGISIGQQGAPTESPGVEAQVTLMGADILKPSESTFAQGSDTAFLFWTPSEETARTEESRVQVKPAIASMEAWLNNTCGGYTRWAVIGGWRNPSTKVDETLPGFFSWVSCPGTPAASMAGKVKELFGLQEVYIKEIPV